MWCLLSNGTSGSKNSLQEPWPQQPWHHPTNTPSVCTLSPKKTAVIQNGLCVAWRVAVTGAISFRQSGCVSRVISCFLRPVLLRIRGAHQSDRSFPQPCTALLSTQAAHHTTPQNTRQNTNRTRKRISYCSYCSVSPSWCNSLPNVSNVHMHHRKPSHVGSVFVQQSTFTGAKILRTVVTIGVTPKSGGYKTKSQHIQ